MKNFTVSGNFFTLLKDIQGVGADLDFLGSNFGSPSVLVPALAVAGEYYIHVVDLARGHVKALQK